MAVRAEIVCSDTVLTHVGYWKISYNETAPSFHNGFVPDGQYITTTKEFIEVFMIFDKAPILAYS